MIIYTDFNLNVLIQLFFLFLNKLFFFLSILINNNLPLNIYCESIMKILWHYFSILISYSLFYVSLILFYFLSIFPSSFFPLFFSSTHVPLIFFFFISFFHLFPYHFLHTCALTFFLYFLLSSFSLPLHTPERSTSLHLFFFFLTIQKLQGSRKREDDDDEEDEDDWNIRKSLISLLNSHWVCIWFWFWVWVMGFQLMV